MPSTQKNKVPEIREYPVLTKQKVISPDLVEANVVIQDSSGKKVFDERMLVYSDPYLSFNNQRPKVA